MGISSRDALEHPRMFEFEIVFLRSGKKDCVMNGKEMGLWRGREGGGAGVCSDKM